MWDKEERIVTIHKINDKILAAKLVKPPYLPKFVRQFSGDAWAYEPRKFHSEKIRNH